MERLKSDEGSLDVGKMGELAKTFYSRMQKSLEKKMPASAPVKQVEDIISDPQNAHSDEVKWSGIMDWLNEQKGKVSKRDVMNYLDENNIQVSERLLSSKPKVRTHVVEHLKPDYPEDKFQQFLKDHPDLWTKTPTGYTYEGEDYRPGELRRELAYEIGAGHPTPEGDSFDWEKKVFPTVEEAQKYAATINPDHLLFHGANDTAAEGATRWGTNERLVTPGGQNYHELLLKWGNGPGTVSEWAPSIEHLPPTEQKRLREIHQMANDGDANDADFAEMERLEKKAKRLSKSRGFRTYHFPDDPNLLAHIRFNDRTDADGKKVLFIEEVQSDWHQQGREKGYDTPESVAATGRQVTDLRLQASRIRRQINRLNDQWLSMPVYHTGRPALERQINELTTQEHQLEDQADSAKSATVADAPFKNNWHELAMKRMLRYAAEHGYDKVAWTTGTQQAKRNDKLLEGIQELEYNPRNGQVFARQQGSLRNIGPSVKPEDLASVVGPGMAKRLLEAPVNERGSHKIEGSDISIGGEFYKLNYDQKIPQFLNKYGKQWGAKVGQAKIATKDEVRPTYAIQEAPDVPGKYQLLITDPLHGGTYIGSHLMSHGDVVQLKDQMEKHQDEIRGVKSVHSIDVTPAMKKSVLHEGQPIARAQRPSIPYTSAPPREMVSA